MQIRSRRSPEEEIRKLEKAEVGRVESSSGRDSHTGKSRFGSRSMSAAAPSQK
jgi:hypothetical protein